MSDMPPPGHVPPGSTPSGAPQWPGSDAPTPAWPPPNQPPPPSQPPTAAWGTEPPILAETSYGPGAGGEPPRPSNRGLLVTLAIVAVLVLVGGIAAAVVVATDAVTDDPTSAATDEPTDRPRVQRDDPSDDALERVLALIDESELTMIQFQIDAGNAAGDAGIEEAGDRAAGELRRLGSDLRELEVGGTYAEAVVAVRDTYLAHLEAWERYVAAAADDASALDDPSGDFWQDITDTADVFVDAVEDGLPNDIPDDLFDYADFILDRGFRGADEAPTGTLV